MFIDSGEIPTRSIEINPIPVPKEAESIINAAKDLHTVCSENKVSYRTVGSLAVVGAIGRFHRIPGDVDAWYDSSKAIILRDRLRELGYSHSLVDAPGNIFPNPLEHFVRDKNVIELRGANFTERGIEYPIHIAIPGIPIYKRPEIQLVTPSVMAEPATYLFGNQHIVGLISNPLEELI